MVWTSISPNGTKSVKQNTPIMAANTTYTETTLNKDHFWNIGVNEDGRHKFVQAPAYTVEGNPEDPALGTGMSGVMYYKTVSATNTRIEGFYRNTNGIYQFIPSFLSGSVDLTGSSFVNVVTVPNNSYGQIYAFGTDGSSNMSWGFFKATGNVVQAFSALSMFGDAFSATPKVNFGNSGNASGLNIRMKREAGSAGFYSYRIVYWGV